MWQANIWYEGLSPADEIILVNEQIDLIAETHKEASRCVNRILRNGMRIGKWFIPPGRIVVIGLEEVRYVSSIHEDKEG